MRRPKVIVNCVASRYANNSRERVIEFSSKYGGGLISFFERDDGKLVVDLYRLDPNVIVRREKRIACGVENP